MFSITSQRKNHISNVATQLIQTLLFLCTLMPAFAHTRIASNRTVTLGQCETHADRGHQCQVIHQYDHIGQFAAAIHLRGESLEVADIAINHKDQILIVGSYKTRVLVNKRATRHRTWVHLLIDSDGELVMTKKLDFEGDSHVHAVEYDANGQFILHTSLDTEGIKRHALIYLDDQGEIEETIEGAYDDALFPINRTVEDDDDDENEDPIG